MFDIVRTVLRKIAARMFKQEDDGYDAQRRVTDKLVADLDAIVANMKRARERSETQLSALDGSYIHPTKWRDAG